MNEHLLKSRLFSSVELCADEAHAIDTSGWVEPGRKSGRLVPDDTKAYVKFRVAGAWPGRTAYGTTLHPGTIARSFPSMFNQLVNDQHLMKVHDPDNANARDHVIGNIVALDYPPAPAPGWKMMKENPPMVQVAAVLHKQVARVPDILREHLGGIHKWTVSQEVYFDRLESGFVVETGEWEAAVGRPGSGSGWNLAARTPPARMSTAARELLVAHTPEEMMTLGLGYVPYDKAPSEMVKCYDPGASGMKKDWENCRLSMLKGGLNGNVHWGGVGLVRYGAEREAEIQDLLASDPDALFWEDYRNFLADGKKVVDGFRELCSHVAT